MGPLRGTCDSDSCSALDTFQKAANEQGFGRPMPMAGTAAVTSPHLSCAAVAQQNPQSFAAK